MSDLKPELQQLVEQILALEPEDRKDALHAVFGSALSEVKASPEPEEETGPLWYGRPVDQETYGFLARNLGIFGITQLEQPTVEEVLQANEKIRDAKAIATNVRWYLSDFEFNLASTRALNAIADRLGIENPNYQQPTAEEIWSAILAGGWRKP